MGKKLVKKSKEQIALERSRLNKIPNTNFNNAWDLDILGKLKGLCGFGSTCTNTATSFYYPNRTTAGSRNLIDNPEEAGFVRINLKDVVPGSIIVMTEPDETGRHTVIFDGVSNKNYTNKYGDEILIGDTLVNYSNGKRETIDYRLQRPMNKVFPENQNIFILNQNERKIRIIST